MGQLISPSKNDPVIPGILPRNLRPESYREFETRSIVSVTRGAAAMLLKFDYWRKSSYACRAKKIDSETALYVGRQWRNRMQREVDQLVARMMGLAWIIHGICWLKKKRCSKRPMNTGFSENPAFSFRAPSSDILLYTTALVFLLPPSHSSGFFGWPDHLGRLLVAPAPHLLQG